MSKISIEEAYTQLVNGRHRDNPKVFAVFRGTDEEGLAKKLYKFGFLELKKHIHQKKGLGGRLVSVYRLVATPHTPPKFQ